MSKIHMRGLEFYITNVCNLTCENCRSFNNYKFSGLYEFDQPAIQAWAEKIHITDISILGGEPTLHPRLEQWVAGLRAAWPLSNIRLTTNGTYLNKVRGLHDMLAKYRCNIQISSHSYELRNLIADEMFAAFGECEILPMKPTSSQHYQGVNSVFFKTDKGVVIDLQNNNFLQDICFVDDQFTLRNNDPVKAHNSCGIANCHHMIDNKIYKCSVVGLLPEFLKQQKKDTTNLLPYHGLPVEEVTQETIDQLVNPMPHCSICPESNRYQPIKSFLKKDLKFSKDTL